MSYAEMRKALEATKSFLDYIVVVDTLSERKHNLSEQIDSALKSEPTTTELVSELRKRDGVEVFEIDGDGYAELKCTKAQWKHHNLVGVATILRITDLTEVKKQWN